MTPKGAGKKLVVVAVDRSFSMRTKEGTSTRLDEAKAEALNVLSKLPPGQPAQVVALADTLQAMTQQTTDPGELRGAVSAIKESDARASFGELARYLRTLSESTKTPLDVHLISDLQKSGMPPGFTDVRLDQDTDITFHPIGKVQPNWAVETVIAPQHVYDPKRVRISATVTGFSAPAATRTVTLLMNGKTIQSKSVNVPENGRGVGGIRGTRSGLLRIQPLRNPDRFGGRAAGRRSLRVFGGADRSQESAVRGRRTASASAGVFPRGLERYRRTRRSSWNRCGRTSRPTRICRSTPWWC